MVVILAVVLSISVILYSEIRVIRNIGNSVVAFYSADTGVERTLYVERKQIPEGGTRGLCNIPSICPDCSTTFDTMHNSDCVPTSCRDCGLSYKAFFDGDFVKSYIVSANITPIASNTHVTINSSGTYKNTTRAINIDMVEVEPEGNGQGYGNNDPYIGTAYANKYSLPDEKTSFSVSADISSVIGLSGSSIKAHIKNQLGNDAGIILLQNSYGNIYEGQWTGSEGDYSVSIIACNTNRECSIKNNIQINFEVQ